MTKAQFAEIASLLPADAIIHGNQRGGYIFLSATKKQHCFKTYNEAIKALIKTKADIKELYAVRKNRTEKNASQSKVISHQVRRFG